MRVNAIYLLETGVLAGILGGCGGLAVTTEDVVVTPGQPAQFVVFLDRQYLKTSVPNANVTVSAGGKTVGQTTTNADGVATITAPLEGAPTQYEARAALGDQRAGKVGRIFNWDPRRTAVAIDVDDTISHTDYLQLFLTDVDNVSPALAHSVQALHAMRNDFQIVYISARPRWLHEKTRLWLSHHDFPPGPILHASKFEACMHQAAYKRAILADFQRSYPNLLIGIGDKDADEIACGDNRMLTVILGGSRNAYKPHCVVLRNWQEVGKFFAEHRKRLVDAASLASTIQACGMNLRPLFAPELEPAVEPTLVASGLTRNRSEVTAAPLPRRAPTPSMESRDAPRATRRPDRPTDSD
jgi:hypothetical protein